MKYFPWVADVLLCTEKCMASVNSLKVGTFSSFVFMKDEGKGAAMIPFVSIASDLDCAGLMWQPEVGDEITRRDEPGDVSILFDSQGLTPRQLRQVYLWLPSLDQLVEQLEARQAILAHAGLQVTESGMFYKTVVEIASVGTIGKETIEGSAESLRSAMGIALRRILLGVRASSVH